MPIRHPSFGTARRGFIATGACLVLAACGLPQPAADVSAAPVVSGATGFRPDPAGGSWSLTTDAGTLQVRGRASSVAYVALGLRAPTCAPTRVRVGTSTELVRGEARATTTVALDDRGHGAIAVRADAPGCAGGPATLVVGPAATTVLGSSWAPWVEPAEGFDLPERVGDQTGWWMTSERARLDVHGDALARVEVLVDLAPTPCGPAVVVVAGVAHAVSAPIALRTRLRLDASGHGTVPLQATSGVCRPGADTRPLRAMVFAPRALAVR